jgi:hypothetical protein
MRKYTINRSYRDFVDDEIQDELIDGLRKTKNNPFEIIKRLINKIFKK